jgi:hypothetical protein
VLGLKNKRHDYVEIRMRIRARLSARQTPAARPRALAPAQNCRNKIKRRGKLAHTALTAKKIRMPQRPILKRMAYDAFNAGLADKPVPL